MMHLYVVHIFNLFNIFNIDMHNIFMTFNQDEASSLYRIYSWNELDETYLESKYQTPSK
jgi:hypothetical protein